MAKQKTTTELHDRVKALEKELRSYKALVKKTEEENTKLRQQLEREKNYGEQLAYNDENTVKSWRVYKRAILKPTWKAASPFATRRYWKYRVIIAKH